jgi:hypothetical protein
VSGQSVGSYDFDKMGTYALTKDSSNGRPVYHQVLPDALWSPVTDLIVSVQTNAMKGKQHYLYYFASDRQEDKAHVWSINGTRAAEVLVVLTLTLPIPLQTSTPQMTTST